MSDEQPLVCGWEIPGFTVYVCILRPHGPEVVHKPLWLTLEQRDALATLRRNGRAQFGADQ